ncbi:uncharacterized protein LOC135698933 [Ochlerotatus camptorhynchus]|uniref:uncharacterized protein LOC135698933 n=1 Tax=Ochlerotatus camptorhynchus TaxID=644619 RepID=UPI0031D22D1D
MTDEQTASLMVLDDYVCGENTGAHGNIYQRDLAFVLFVRGSMKKFKFKLATEMTDAGKFDDVVVYAEDLKETWLIQAKHAQLDASNPSRISEKELLPSDVRLLGKDFDLFKYMHSYVQVEGVLKGKKRYFILTNKDLQDSDNLKKWIRDAEVDALINFSDFGGAYKKLEPDVNDIIEMLPMVNAEFYKIKNAIVNVFKTGQVDKLLMNFKTPVAKILSVQNKVLRFSNDFLKESNAELYKMLLKDFKQELSLVEVGENPAIKSLLDKTKSRNQELPVFLNETKVTEFFESLTLCVNQPNELRNIVDQDIRMWLRTWVRPDDLGKFGESQLKLPASKFDEVFKGWDEPDMKGVAKSKNKSFLHSDVGTNCWNEIIKELEQFTTRHIDVLRSYYVNREVIFTENDNGTRQHSEINDNEFSKQLTNGSIEDKYLVLIADPGMGKTTFLQYVSFEVQKLTSRAIFFIYLNSLKDKLLNTSECIDLTRALDIIGPALSVSNNLLLHNIFINKEDNMNNEGDIWFFLDGFDEVPASENVKLISVVRQLLNTQRVRIVISGRKHVEKDLRDALAAKVIYLKPFRYIDQMTFLEKFWSISVEDPIVFPKFQKYAEGLLDRFYKNLYKSTMLPLMIRLLAEVYTDDLERFLLSHNETEELDKLSTEVFSVVSLFDQFARKSFNMKMLKKFDLDPYSKNDPYDDEMDLLFEQYIFEHELAAINTFRSMSQLQDVLTDHEKVYEKFRKRIEAGKEKSLLININEPQIKFVHESFAEYFVARYLYENLQHCVDYLCSIIEDQELIRRFFFLFLNEDVEQSSKQLPLLSTVGEEQNFAFWACEALCLGVMKSLSNNHDFRTFFSEKYGSLLHVAAKNGSTEICQFLLDTIKINVSCLSCKELNDIMGLFPIVNQFEEQLSIHYQVTALHLAAAYEHKAVVKLLLEHSADVNARTGFLFTPLHVAAKKGHIAMMKLLINKSADLNLQTYVGDTPLHLAIDFNQHQCAELLIDHGANVNISNNCGSTPLVLAVRKGFSSIVNQLISKKANVVFDSNGRKLTLLHLAAESGDLDTVKQIIALSADINALSKSGETPLSIAASGGHVKIVEHLIGQMASVNALKIDDTPPLHCAIINKHNAVVKVLIAHSADVHAPDSSGRTPLHLAAESDLDIVKLLIDTLVDVNAVDGLKRTALHLAVFRNKPLIAELLIEHSADPNLADTNGWTPLHFAAYVGSLEAITLLVEQSIDINARTSDEQTPLHLAASSGYRDIVEILVRKSADLNAVDIKNRTPLYVAINKNYTYYMDLLITTDNVNIQDHQNLTPLLLATQIDESVNYVQFLIEKNSNVNASRKDGWTVLHWAAEKGHFDIAVLLIERSAHVNAQDGSRRTPLHQAAANGHTTIVELLIRHSADVTAVDKDKDTPLHLAVGKGQTECVKLLITATESTPLHLTNVNAVNKRKWTPLHLAVHHGYREIMQLLIDTSPSAVSAQDKEGKTPLHIAAINIHPDVAKLLINASASVDALDNHARTPLHLAARCGHKQLVELLLIHSADVNARDKNGKTPLDLATSSRRTEVVRLLSVLSHSERSSTVGHQIDNMEV